MSIQQVIADISPLLAMLASSGSMVMVIAYCSKLYEDYRNKDPKNVDFIFKVLDFLFIGHKPDSKEKDEILANRKKNVQKGDSKGTSSSSDDILSVAFLFVGLQISFLTWGWVQERIMTTTYDGTERFKSSNMLVFSSRLFAIAFSLIVIYFSNSRKFRAPLFSFSLPAIANTLSSFAAFESLKFLSFPTSTVCKTLKIIPTMIIGTIVHKKVYSKEEYASGLLITCGAALFAIEFGAGGIETVSESSSSIDLSAVIPGIILMAAYLAVDAFTSNLQMLLFQVYLLTPYECMLGINVFSLILGLFNLWQSEELVYSLTFFSRHPDAFLDIFLLALSSASGQLFIYYTIERHGPLTFTIIQLTRQLLAILLSSWSFGHKVNVMAWLGILMTFSGMLAMNLASKGKKKHE